MCWTCDFNQSQSQPQALRLHSMGQSLTDSRCVVAWSQLYYSFSFVSIITIQHVLYLFISDDCCKPKNLVRDLFSLLIFLIFLLKFLGEVYCKHDWSSKVYKRLKKQHKYLKRKVICKIRYLGIRDGECIVNFKIKFDICVISLEDWRVQRGRLNSKYIYSLRKRSVALISFCTLFF